MLKKALFRCDASKQIGTGHIIRCLTLANEMQKHGWSCSFAVSEETLPVVPMLMDSEYLILNPDFIKENYDVIIFDHYGLDKTAEQAVRNLTSCIVVIDDLADRPHDCDILMDQTYGRPPADYKELTPSHARILTGANYALLRDQFQMARQASLQRRLDGKVKKLFVLISGTDPDNVMLKVIDALKQSPALSRLPVDIVLGEQAIERMNVRKLIAGNDRITLHQDVRDMAAMMSSADLAIGAGGTASWERCCLGLPTIIIEIADNQKFISGNLSEAGAAINLGWHADVSYENIANAIIDFINHPQKVANMSQRAADICDGLGVRRVVQCLHNTMGIK